MFLLKKIQGQLNFIKSDFLGVLISNNLKVMLTFRKRKEFVFVSYAPSDLPVAIPLPWVIFSPIIHFVFNYTVKLPGTMSNFVTFASWSVDQSGRDKPSCSWINLSSSGSSMFSSL